MIVRIALAYPRYGEVDELEAKYVKVLDSGALEVSDRNGSLQKIYAAMAWRTVTRKEE